MAHFHDRTDAARRLAVTLVDVVASLGDGAPVVIGVPPNGVEIGRVIAEALDADLDVVLTNRLLAPDDPSVVIGSVSESGRVHVNYVADILDVSPEWIGEASIRELQELRRRAQVYKRHEVPVRGRLVILVDDGSSTGATLMTSMDALRDAGATQIVVAVPVIGQEASSRVGVQVQALVCLESPSQVESISAWYDAYEQVSDQRAARTLRAYQRTRQALSG